jgi:carboxyl-terminal processing protease
VSKLSWLVLLPALHLAACGGDSGGSTATGGTPTPAPTPTPTTAGGTCDLAARQVWAKSVLDEWYLFPETLPATLDTAPYGSVTAYIDKLTETARNQRRDRGFTYITSIAQETAFFSSGSSAGFGVRLSTDAGARRAFINEAFEGAPALVAGIDRGDEIVAIGESPATLRQVTDIIAAEGTGGVTNALGPSTVGTTRTLRVARAGVTREVTVAKADYALTPVSARYGAKIIDDGGRRVGYINLRTFISTADNELRNAFANFRAQGITNFVIDFRYNGGGLVSTAELMGDLLGGNRASTDVFGRVTYRPEKSGQNSQRRFIAQPQSVSPVKIAFIGTGATASASELVINGMVPFFGNNVALIGSNTFGKPVGQIAIDRSVCDDRLRVTAFALQNGAGNATYFDGLATTVSVTCRAGDDVTKPLGDAQEASVRQALDFLAGTPCTPITASAATASTQGPGDGAARATIKQPVPELLVPDAPTAAQREVPGLF